MYTHPILNAIGNTPYIQIENIYAKLETFNPSGSIKDRIALAMIEGAEQEGKLKPGDTIVEATSGNTGIAIAMVGKAKGYQVIICMPEHMSQERKQMIQAYGAKLVLNSPQGSFAQAMENAREFAKRPHTFHTDQFANPYNVAAQQKTAEELLSQIGPVDALVAGVGTGGTLMGMAKTFRQANPALKVYAVEPAESNALWAKMNGKTPRVEEHVIQGIGDGFIPEIIDQSQIDETILVAGNEAFQHAKTMATSYNLMMGISSAANLIASRKIQHKFKKIATVFADRGERYISMGLYN